MCFVWIWEQTAIISLYSINWLVFITQMECVYCAVRVGYLYIIHINLLYRLRRNTRGCEYLQLTKTMTYYYTTDRPALSSERESASRLSTHRLRCWPRAPRGTRHQDGLTDWLTEWQTDWLTDWLKDWLTDWQTDWLTVWQTDWLIYWLIDWLTDWLTERQTDRLTDWKTETDWLTNILTDWPPVLTRLSVWLWSLSWYSHEFHVTAWADWLTDWKTD